ncbi:MAG TPA: four helix bundle protein [Nitrospira sp.]|nr:four helix bundle protein [Nitrospira sp.]
MPSFKSFKDIEAWQKARELTKDIYAISKDGSFAKDFGLRDQIRRATVSIMANIAEGHERSGSGEFIQFLSVAKGSAGEVSSHLCVALDLGYLDRSTFDRLSSATDETGRLIGALMRYLKNSGIKGGKYK